MVPVDQQFSAYGPSHWIVLAVAAVGAVGWVMLGRRGDPRCVRVCARIFAVVMFALNVGTEVSAIQPAHLVQTLPLQLSDLAPYAAAWALWSWRQWAFSLTYYWGLVLSTQALVTPALTGPDFPSVNFLAFFALHVFVVWAAIFLAWGLGLRPNWPSYGLTVAVTAGWAGAMLVLNSVFGTNYGFVSAKPATGSLLDLLGPWPWYLLPESALILAVWALMTALWRPGHA
jgi:hypothetical integral membrane protein (TIGR02206 family)